MRSLLALTGVLSLACAAPAGAVIIVSGDGTGNTAAPADDPGFAHVGRSNNGLSAVYIGDAWILTAHHVCAETRPEPCDVEIEGVTHREVDGSRHRLLTEGVDPADLVVFRIQSDPGLPPLTLSTDPPSGEVVLIGKGTNRGDPIYDWDDDPPWRDELDGWYWGPGTAMRWGTNQVKQISEDLTLGGRTIVFTADFSASGGTEHECQAATGDSGGAVFAKVGGVWKLTGILVARAYLEGQDDWEDTHGKAALFGNESWAAQLSHYRDPILDEITSAAPACNNGMDDDGDGLVDFPDDPGCLDLGDAFERSADLPCDDGLDNDGDGYVDHPDDVGCYNPHWFVEDPACENDIDDDGDGLTDLADPGCITPFWMVEDPLCQNGSDDDADGLIDFDGGQSVHGACHGGTCPPGVSDPDLDGIADPDPECHSPGTLDEKSCGLGAELALLMPPLMWLRRRR